MSHATKYSFAHDSSNKGSFNEAFVGFSAALFFLSFCFGVGGGGVEGVKVSTWNKNDFWPKLSEFARWSYSRKTRHKICIEEEHLFAQVIGLLRGGGGDSPNLPCSVPQSSRPESSGFPSYPIRPGGSGKVQWKVLLLCCFWGFSSYIGAS